MNIDDLIQDLQNSNGLRNGVFRRREYNDERDIRANAEITQYVVDFENFGRVFHYMVRFLEPVQNQVGRKYIRNYDFQPRGCRNHILTFAPPSTTDGFNDGWLADNYRWIARMPLRNTINSVLIYFPREIVVDESLFRFEISPRNTPISDYAIPNDIEDFIANPERFLSIERIRERLLNRV